MSNLELGFLWCCALWLGILVAIPVGGCASVGVEKAKAYVADIDNLNSGARTDIAKAKPHADDIGKGHIAAANNKLVQQGGKIKQLDKELDSVGKSRARDLQALKKAHEEYDKLDNSWAMWIGRSILAAVWILAGGWIVLQVVGGVLFGRGIGTKYAEKLLDALPGSNVGYWVADKARKKGAK